MLRARAESFGSTEEGASSSLGRAEGGCDRQEPVVSLRQELHAGHDQGGCSLGRHGGAKMSPLRGGDAGDWPSPWNLCDLFFSHGCSAVRM